MHKILIIFWLLYLFLYLGFLILYLKTKEDYDINTKSNKELECNNIQTDFTIKPTQKLTNYISKIDSTKRDQYISILQDADEVFTRNGLFYILIEGTLLGSYRHNDVIPWDDDADICIRLEDHDKLMGLKDQLHKKGIELSEGCMACWSDYYKDVCEYINDHPYQYTPISMTEPCKASRYIATLNKYGLHVDIFHIIPIYDKNNNVKYSLLGDNNLISKEKYEELLETTDCKLGDATLKCPSNSKELLCTRYGKNLQIPDTKGMKNKDKIKGMWNNDSHGILTLAKDKKGKYIFKTQK